MCSVYGISIKKKQSRCLAAALLLVLIGSCAAEVAAQGRVVGRQPVEVIVRAAASLTLRVGSQGGQVDVVRFDVTDLPGTGAVTGISSGQNPVPIQARAQQLSGQLIISADSSQPLSDGAGHTIPFSEIGWIGARDMPSGIFTGSTAQVLLVTGDRNVNGAMTFYYENRLYVSPGTYSGRVIFTLSSP
jgi:hypothetical protein